MAERRMFAKVIIGSDAFLAMPLSAQALYFHLAMRADDDGFVGNPQRIRSMIEASKDDFNCLVANRFLLTFESGVVVIKHWKIHNYIQSDRYKETTYLEERSTLKLDRKKVYTECIQNVYKMYPQDSIERDKYSQDKRESARAPARDDETKSSGYGEFGNVILTEEEFAALKEKYPDDYKRMIENLSSYMKRSGKTYESHYATILHFAQEDEKKADKEVEERQKHRYGDFDADDAFEQALRRSYGEKS